MCKPTLQPTVNNVQNVLYLSNKSDKKFILSDSDWNQCKWSWYPYLFTREAYTNFVNRIATHNIQNTTIFFTGVFEGLPSSGHIIKEVFDLEETCYL